MPDNPTTVGGSVVYTREPIRRKLLKILRSDSVRTFIWLYYFWFIAGAIHLAFFTYPIKVIVGPMGISVYDAWAWMPLIAAPTALIGLWLRHGGSPSDQIKGRLLRQDFLGLWMQVGGHVCMAVVLAIFIITAWMGREPYQPIPSAFWLMAYFMGVCSLAAQCVDKVGLGMGWWK